jgi:hypothetical protein
VPDVVYDAVFGAISGGRGAVTLRQITNSNLNENIDVLDGRFSGDAFIADQFIQAVRPTFDLTTTDIANFKAIFGTGYADANRIVDGQSVVIPWHGRKSGGTFLSGASHVRVRGFSNTSPVQLVPVSVTAPRQGAVTAQGQVHFLSRDGIEMPHEVAVNTSLASQAFQSMYGLGPVFINGDRLPRQVGFTVNYGIGLSEMQHFDGTAMPTDCFIETVTPSIEVTAEDFDYIATITGGLEISSVSAFLRKRLSGSTYEDEADDVHFEFSFASGIITPQAIGAQDTKHGQAVVRLAGRILVTSDSAAIP